VHGKILLLDALVLLVWDLDACWRCRKYLMISNYTAAAAVMQVCSQEQLLMLVHEGGLINKLCGMMPQHSDWTNMSFNMMSNGPNVTINMLTAVWTNKAHELSKQLSKRVQGGRWWAGGWVSCKWKGFLQEAARCMLFLALHAQTCRAA
jgi:hypothetical protein